MRNSTCSPTLYAKSQNVLHFHLYAAHHSGAEVVDQSSDRSADKADYRIHDRKSYQSDHSKHDPSATNSKPRIVSNKARTHKCIYKNDRRLDDTDDQAHYQTDNRLDLRNRKYTNLIDPKSAH